MLRMYAIATLISISFFKIIIIRTLVSRVHTIKYNYIGYE